jgi:GntR family transcriptional repressor for pyruvate dehydrogenase complex
MSHSNLESPLAFQSVTVTRPFEQIVEQIAQAIRAGRYAKGAKLPTERELSVAFGVSRGVVREAVKVLDTMGLVESRQGSGIYVRNDSLPSVTRALTLSVSPEEKSVGGLFEFRRALETFAARCAAERRTAAEAAAIKDAAMATKQAAAENDRRAFGAGDSLLHTLLYAAAGNPYIAIAASAVREMQTDVAHLFPTSPGSIAVAAAQHGRIAEAVVRQDVPGAAAAMEEHVLYTAATVDAILHGQIKEGGKASKEGSA